MMAFNAAEGAEFKYDSDLKLDGSSTMSFHKVGWDVHIRIQHNGISKYEVAVIREEDVVKVALELLKLGLQ